VPQVEIKAIMTNITRSDQELENFHRKAQKSKSSKQNSYLKYIISKDTKNAKIIKKIFERWCNGLYYMAFMPN
jgi:hypothetical protein